MAISFGRVAGFLVLCLRLLFNVSAEDAPGSFEIINASLRTPFPGCRINYSAFVYTVPTGRIRLRPAKPGVDNGALPVWHGLTELRCGSCIVSSEGESSLRHRSSAYVPTNAVPLLHASDFPVTDFLLRAHWKSVNASLASFVEDTENAPLSGVVVLEARLSPLCAVHGIESLEKRSSAGSHEQEQSEPFQHACLAEAVTARSSCAVRLLAPEEQRGRSVPAVIERGSVAASRSQQWPLQPCSSTSCPATVSRIDEIQRSASATVALLSGRRILAAAFPDAHGLEQRGFARPVDSEPAASSLLEKGTSRHRKLVHQRRKKRERPATLQPKGSPDHYDDTLFLEGRTGAAARASAGAAEIPGLPKMIEPLIKGLLKPAIGLLGGIIGDLLEASFGEVLLASIDSGITGEIVGQISRSLATGLTDTVVPPLTETITDAVLQSVPGSLVEAVSNKVAERLAEGLSKTVIKTLSSTVTDELVGDVPERLSSDVTASLAFLLTQSVTQSVVPALTHTLQHNPAEDYYCAYCSAHQLYCNLCKRGGPEQLSRAEYYAAYYSRHYANAYSAASTGSGEGTEATGLFAGAEPPLPAPA